MGKRGSETRPREPTGPQVTAPAGHPAVSPQGRPSPIPGRRWQPHREMRGLDEGVDLPPRWWSFALDASDQAGSKLIGSIVWAFKTLHSPRSPAFPLSGLVTPSRPSGFPAAFTFSPREGVSSAFAAVRVVETHPPPAMRSQPPSYGHHPRMQRLLPDRFRGARARSLYLSLSFL